MKWLIMFCKANSYPFKVFRDYLRFSSTAELFVDIGIPIILGAGLTYVISRLWVTNQSIVVPIQQINNQVLTAISILAGFNVASISVFASSNSPLLTSLREEMSKKYKDKSIFDMILTFFSWAVVAQLLIIFFGIIILFVCSFHVTSKRSFHVTPFELYTVVCIWMACVFHTICVSIRNLKTLLLYLANTR